MMSTPSKLPLSIAIVARDAVATFAQCLDSLSFADDIVVVVDDRSQDDTLAIAQAHGCRTFNMAWKGYAQQKQLAVDLCHHDWVLVLDADESVPKQTADAIACLIQAHTTDWTAYRLLRKNFFHGQWMKRCGWWPDRVVRLVDRTKGNFSHHRVHEHWMTEGPIGDLQMCIEHRSFQNYADLVEKMQKYSTLAAIQMKEAHRTTHFWTPLGHGIWMFVRTYFLELGIVAGFDGLIISLLNAGGSFLKYAKLRELRFFEKSSVK